MKPAPFDYFRARMTGEAIRAFAECGPDSRYLAGGQSLIAMMNMRVAAPKTIIDVSRLEDADYIREDREHIAVGCSVRQVDLEAWPRLTEKIPLLAQALPWIGHVQTRSRGTVCGSIAHADPSSELPLCLALLDGEVVLQSTRDRRTVSGRSFFQGVLQTARNDEELITEVRWPKHQSGTGFAFNEMAIRHGDFAIVGIGAMVDEAKLAIAIGGASNRPEVREFELAENHDLEDTLNELAWSIDCKEDQHASAAYRRHLVRTLGKRTIAEAMACRS
ncbi:MAG: FAD binding domain-containing protein [Hyphomicrobiaceae bacterium]